jgi:hypothetical protein
VERALNILTDTSRELQTRGWRFNTEFNYFLTPVATVTQGGETFNVFLPPAGLAGFRLTLRDDQYGMDAVVRKSRVYQQSGQNVPVIFDRINGHDGFKAGTLYIDPVWFMAFGDLPETARRYIVVAAARRFAADQGALDRAQFTEADEQTAAQALTLDQGRAQPQVAPWGARTSELDALNQILTNLGQDEVQGLNALTPVAARALNILRRTSREVQAEGWSFNTDLGLKLQPLLTVDGLNIFAAPERLIAWHLTSVPEQREMAVTIKVKEDGEFFYDLRLNRDGFTATELLIDATFHTDFDRLPDVARRLITALASRTFAETLPDGLERFRVTADELARAWRQMVKEHSIPRRHSFFGSTTALDFMGRRRGSASFLPRMDY